MHAMLQRGLTVLRQMPQTDQKTTDEIVQACYGERPCELHSNVHLTLPVAETATCVARPLPEVTFSLYLVYSIRFMRTDFLSGIVFHIKQEMLLISKLPQNYG
jgi:hypothetical protein